MTLQEAHVVLPLLGEHLAAIRLRLFDFLEIKEILMRISILSRIIFIGILSNSQIEINCHAISDEIAIIL